MPDIDIDFANRDIILDKITHRVAKLDTGKKHNTGVYLSLIHISEPTRPERIGGARVWV